MPAFQTGILFSVNLIVRDRFPVVRTYLLAGGNGGKTGTSDNEE